MFIILIGIYIFCLAFIWGFFILTKIHVYKFKTLNKNIEKYTTFFLIILSIFTIIGLSLIYFIGNQKIVVNQDETTENVYY